MGLFNKKEEQEERPVNPNSMMTIRMAAVVYLLYLVYDMIQSYFNGGEDAPSLGLLLVTAVLLGGGAIWIAVVSYKQWNRMKQEQQEAYEEQARLEVEKAAEQEGSELPEE